MFDMHGAKRLALTAALFSGLLAAQDKAKEIESLMQKATSRWRSAGQRTALTWS
jgi:hypothetical protein